MKELINGKHEQLGVAGFAGETVRTGFSGESFLHGAVSGKNYADLVTISIWTIFFWRWQTTFSEWSVTSAST